LNLRLKYTEARSDGIFGWILLDDTADGEARPLCVFVTHAYKQPDGTWRPKVRAGAYECARGPHRLDGMTEDFETFAVLGVAGHSGILFHWGNWGDSSKGCFCVGKKILLTGEDRDGVDGPDEMVTESRATFAEFMAAQRDVAQFQLLIEEQFPSGG
jgi:hypothetical protein